MALHQRPTLHNPPSEKERTRTPAHARFVFVGTKRGLWNLSKPTSPKDFFASFLDVYAVSSPHRGQSTTWRTIAKTSTGRTGPASGQEFGPIARSFVNSGIQMATSMTRPKGPMHSLSNCTHKASTLHGCRCFTAPAGMQLPTMHAPAKIATYQPPPCSSSDTQIC